MKKHIKKKKAQNKPFDVGAYELHNNALYKHKVIPNKIILALDNVSESIRIKTNKG